MIKIIILGATMVWLTSVFHAFGVIQWNASLRRRFTSRKGPVQTLQAFHALAFTAVFLLCLLICEAVLWAGVYYLFADRNDLITFQNCLAFSFETFTTVGYGEFDLPGLWRLVAGIEAMNGILLFGWSSASLYTIVNFIWTHGTVQTHKEHFHGSEHI